MEIDYFSTAWMTGYGEAARRNLEALVRVGAVVRWRPLCEAGDRPRVEARWPAEALGHPAELVETAFSRPGPQASIVHDLPEMVPEVSPLVEGSGPLAWYTVWEAERLPEEWPALLDGADRVLVPCEWNAATFRGSGLRAPVHVVPHPVSPVEPVPPPVDGLADRFVFYSVSTWSPRKRLDLVVDAFCRAFRPDDDVALFLKTPEQVEFTEHSGMRALASTELALLLARQPWQPTVVLDTSLWSGAEIAGLHRWADCYVSLAHGEGWGLGAFDAAAAGRPVITPGYGGPVDYLGEDHPWFVDHRLVHPDVPTMPTLRSDNEWAEPDVDHAASLMRAVFEQGAEAKRRAGKWADRLNERFSPVAVGQRLVEALA